MKPQQIISEVISAISTITNPRYFETERGYQGELNALLSHAIKNASSELISEIEYQKKEDEHGFNIRPDIIIHEPYSNEKFDSRQEGNFAIIELKLKGTRKSVQKDFESLDLMFEKLNYPLGLFININSDRTLSQFYHGKYPERLQCIAVRLNKAGEVEINKS